MLVVNGKRLKNIISPPHKLGELGKLGLWGMNRPFAWLNSKDRFVKIAIVTTPFFGHHNRAISVRHPFVFTTRARTFWFHANMKRRRLPPPVALLGKRDVGWMDFIASEKREEGLHLTFVKALLHTSRFHLCSIFTLHQIPGFANFSRVPGDLCGTCSLTRLFTRSFSGRALSFGANRLPNEIHLARGAKVAKGAKLAKLATLAEFKNWKIENGQKWTNLSKLVEAREWKTGNSSRNVEMAKVKGLVAAGKWY